MFVVNVIALKKLPLIYYPSKTDSFRNETRLYESVTKSFTQSIQSKIQLIQERNISSWLIHCIIHETDSFSSSSTDSFCNAASEMCIHWLSLELSLLAEQKQMQVKKKKKNGNICLNCKLLLLLNFLKKQYHTRFSGSQHGYNYRRQPIFGTTTLLLVWY